MAAVGAPGEAVVGRPSSTSRTRRRERRLRPRSAPTKRSTKSFGRAAPAGRRACRTARARALVEDRDAVAHLDRLVDVVRDEDHRLPQLAMQAEELVLEALARDRVDRAERLVHQHQRRVRGERAREADALPLPARELSRVALRVSAASSPTSSSSSARPLADPLLRPAEQPRNRADVVADGEMRKEADLLDHVADPPPQVRRGRATARSSRRSDVALRDRDEPVDHLHRRRLAAARRADEDADVTRRNRQRKLGNGRFRPARIALRGPVEDDLGSGG